MKSISLFAGAKSTIVSGIDGAVCLHYAKRKGLTAKKFASTIYVFLCRQCDESKILQVTNWMSDLFVQWKVKTCWCESYQFRSALCNWIVRRGNNRCGSCCSCGVIHSWLWLIELTLPGAKMSSLLFLPGRNPCSLVKPVKIDSICSACNLWQGCNTQK